MGLLLLHLLRLLLHLQLVLQLQGASLLTNYPLAPEDARELAKGLWAGADRTDGGVDAVQ